MHSEEKMELRYIPLNLIDISSLNVRKINPEENLDELVESIKLIGVKQPVTVIEKEDGRFDLIVGQRRYLASKKAGKTTIPAIVTKVSDNIDAIVLSFSENIHRLDLQYQDKMSIAVALLNKYKTPEKVAQVVGVHTNTVKDWLGYALVPEPIKDMVKKGSLGATTALRISKTIEDKDFAIEVANQIREIPRSKDRIDFIDTAKKQKIQSKNKEEKHIEISHKIDEVRNITERFKKMNILTLNLTEKLSNALIEAEKKYASTKEDIALDALEEWLQKRGFIE